MYIPELMFDRVSSITVTDVLTLCHQHSLVEGRFVSRWQVLDLKLYWTLKRKPSERSRFMFNHGDLGHKMA
jgi:hypothetical protein